MFSILNSLNQKTGMKMSGNEILAVTFIRAFNFLNDSECSQISMILKQATLRAVSENESTLDKAD